MKSTYLSEIVRSEIESLMSTDVAIHSTVTTTKDTMIKAFRTDEIGMTGWTRHISSSLTTDTHSQKDLTKTSNRLCKTQRPSFSSDSREKLDKSSTKKKKMRWSSNTFGERYL